VKALWAAALFVALSASAQAHQLVLTAGYANSRRPDTGPALSPNSPFQSGGGWAAGIRVDIMPPEKPVMFGPSFLYWNNLTGDPDPNSRARYFQIELGGRLSVRSRTVPTLYGGVGAGYTFAHGTHEPRWVGTKEEFDGDFPTGSVHFGIKSQTRTEVTVVAEGSFHFGLDHSSGRNSVGPAKAWLVQIGVGFDMLIGPRR
jgi:hypothetical protein